MNADLLHESLLRALLAEARAACPELVAAWERDGEMPATRGLPDPYGPDPVVFGCVPRVAGT